eukprot:TRINITY_DN6109_c0_g1_i1.p1 TRINITY_DN6109_c0_g1~~TRINITY_DN6109_c0_g1_i1.p1  ORF type:complete len:282 (-),score=46.04 TRINITY_DN6109_c0_g1_i1:72-917(-)
MLINVRTLNGNVATLTVQKDSTLAEVKVQFLSHEQMNIPFERVKLFYSGRLMDDDTLVSEIGENSLLMCVVTSEQSVGPEVYSSMEAIQTSHQSWNQNGTEAQSYPASRASHASHMSSGTSYGPESHLSPSMGTHYPVSPDAQYPSPSMGTPYPVSPDAQYPASHPSPSMGTPYPVSPDAQYLSPSTGTPYPVSPEVQYPVFHAAQNSQDLPDTCHEVHEVHHRSRSSSSSSSSSSSGHHKKKKKHKNRKRAKRAAVVVAGGLLIAAEVALVVLMAVALAQ